MRFCRIPRDLGGLGTTGEVAAATAGAMSSYTAGTHNPANAAAMGAAVVAGAAAAFQMKHFPAFLRGLGMGLAPSASFTQATLSIAAFQNAKTGADRFSASLGIITGVSVAIAGLMPPNPVKADLTALSITDAAAQSLVEA